MVARSRTEHINIMTEPGTDAALRAMALSEDTTLTVIVRRAFDRAFKDDPVFHAITSYVKALNQDEYATIKMQMQNKMIPPRDRIPQEIQNIIKEFGDD
jgi:hypothetical protein